LGRTRLQYVVDAHPAQSKGYRGGETRKQLFKWSKRIYTLAIHDMKKKKQLHLPGGEFDFANWRLDRPQVHIKLYYYLTPQEPPGASNQSKLPYEKPQDTSAS